MAESMFGEGANIFDVASGENTNMRDRALKVAQLTRGRVGVYANTLAGGMITSGLARMAGLKTPEEEKAELITNIMEESRNLDPNDPQNSLILARKFIEAGFPDIGQKFAQQYRDMSVKAIELGHKDTELELQAARDLVSKTQGATGLELQEARDLVSKTQGDTELGQQAEKIVLQEARDIKIGEHYDAQAAQNTEELAYRRELEKTRISDLADKLKVDREAVEYAINKGELIEIGVPENTTGAMTWASRICDEKGQNCKTTPLMAEGYKPPAAAATAAVAPVTTVVDGQIAKDDQAYYNFKWKNAGSEFRDGSAYGEGPTAAYLSQQAKASDQAKDSGGAATNINTLAGLNNSGYMISDFGASPTGSAESRAYHVLRDDLIEEYGPSEGSKRFIQKLQKQKEDVAAASTTAQIGVALFNDVRISRNVNADKLDTIDTAISNFAQATAGSGAAEKLAEGLIQQIFASKRLAVSEIERIAKAGSFAENLWDGINSFFTGVKTPEHHAAFLKVLRIYEKEQVDAYNNKSDIMKEFSEQIGYTNLPDSTFAHRTIPIGGFILRFNPETNGFDRVAI
jgi:hypothetical protein